MQKRGVCLHVCGGPVFSAGLRLASGFAVALGCSGGSSGCLAEKRALARAPKESKTPETHERKSSRRLLHLMLRRGPPKRRLLKKTPLPLF